MFRIMIEHCSVGCMASEFVMEWRIISVLLLCIQSTIGQSPSAPTNVVMELQFINGTPSITGRWNAPFGVEVERFLLVVTVNGSLSFNTTVPASTTSVNIFETSLDISQRRYTTYSLRVASIGSAGQSNLTDPVSVVSNFLQSASVMVGVRKIIASCVIATSVPKALCTALISNNMDKQVHTFQIFQRTVTLDFAPGEYNVSIRIHEKIGTNYVITEQSMFWSISIPSVAPSPSFALGLDSTIVLSSLLSTPTITLPSTAMLSISSSSLSTSPSPTVPTSTNVIDDYNADDGDSNGDHGDDDSDDNGSGNDDDGGDNNADYDDHNDDPDKGNNKNVPGVVLAAALLCTLLLSFAIIFTMIVFIWWKLQTNRKSTSVVDTKNKVSEKPRIHISVSTETENRPFCVEELDTIKEERYSVTVGCPKSRINSAFASNHSSYIEMHPGISMDDLVSKNVIMESNPSYSSVPIANS